MHDWQSHKTVIGMLHLLPLPGAPQFAGSLPAIRERMLRDADSLTRGGVHALMIENFGDVPFTAGSVQPHTAAHVAVLADEIHRQFGEFPLGVNVLRNDGVTALSIAHAVGAEFIRVNVLSGSRVTDQGVLDGRAHDLLRLRASLNATQIRIFADVDVKHSSPLAPRPIADEVEDTIQRALADALIVSGAGTGKPTELTKVRTVKTAAGNTPVFIGSGITAETVGNYLPFADGFIVGTAFKEGGIAANPVDAERVKSLLRRVV